MLTLDRGVQSASTATSKRTKARHSPKPSKAKTTKARKRKTPTVDKHGKTPNWYRYQAMESKVRVKPVTECVCCHNDAIAYSSDGEGYCSYHADLMGY